jgi:hypothetical protein
MNADRLRIDLFAFALGALALLTLAFFNARNGAAVVMSGLCIVGLVAARVIGFSNRALVPPAAGLVLILWMVWIAPPAGDRTVGALAHFGGGAVVGWALAEYLRTRLSGIAWAMAALAGVFALTVVWEAGEYFGDLLLTTALDPNRIDSAVDIFFGSVGSTMGLALAALVAPPRKGDRAEHIP